MPRRRSRVRHPAPARPGPDARPPAWLARPLPQVDARPLPPEAALDVYLAVLIPLLSPPNGQLPAAIEVFSIDAERHEPFAPGFRTARPFVCPDAVELAAQRVSLGATQVRVGTMESLAEMRMPEVGVTISALFAAKVPPEELERHPLVREARERGEPVRIGRSPMSERVVRAFIGPPERIVEDGVEVTDDAWPTRVAIEVGYNAGHMHDRHGLWCLSRVDGGWRVDERHFIWMS